MAIDTTDRVQIEDDRLRKVGGRWYFTKRVVNV